MVATLLDRVVMVPSVVTWDNAAPVSSHRGAQQATLQMTLADYKAVNGVMLPHLITRGVNDMTIEEWTIDSYRLNSSFKSDVFTK